MIYNFVFIKVPQKSNYINYELSFKFNVILFNNSINKLSNQLIIMFHNQDFSYAYNNWDCGFCHNHPARGYKTWKSIQQQRDKRDVNNVLAVLRILLNVL